MALSREPIYAALFARLKADSGLQGLVRTFTRRAVGAASIADVQFPALVLEALDQTAQTQEGLPPIWTLTASVSVFTRAPAASADASPEATLFGIVDAVESALEMKPSEGTGFPFGGSHRQTTLGGLVRRVDIERVEMFQAEPGGQLMQHQAAVLFLTMVAV